MKIAIVYICTGKYSIFWKDFFSSSEKYFLEQYEKHYYVFTDDKTINCEDNVSVINRESGGFPYDSLKRFEMFVKIEENLKRSDFVFFFNSNMVLLKPVGTEILPVSEISDLIGVIHPGYFRKMPILYPYERNRRSSAYVPPGKGKYVYYMGSVIGGTSEKFMELSHQCHEWTESDLQAGIIPIYHDESYLNKYFSINNPCELDPGYAYPEGWKLPFDQKIQLINKVFHGGKYFVKVPEQTILRRIINVANRLVNGMFWYFRG